jgi:hypothetical protein
MVAEHAENGALKMWTQARKLGQGRFERAKGACPVISRDNAQVIVERAHALN